jgi:uncharacterized protein (DUF362 family)
MSEWSRRGFLGSAGSAFAAGALRAAPPSMAIARAKTPGSSSEAIAAEAARLTRAAIDALGGMGRFVSRGQVVWIKPNIGWDRQPQQAACSNPDVVAAVVRMCFEAGARKVTVGDNPCVSPGKSYARSGIRQAARASGAICEPLDERRFRRMALRGAAVLKEWEIYAGVVEADRVINITIPKQHSLCRATLGMKNLLGAAGGARNRFHQDIGRTVADLAGFLRPQLVIVDAVRVLAANGPTGGNPADVRRKDTVAAGVDQVAMDAFAASLLGIAPTAVPYVAEAQARGLGTVNFQSLALRTVEV